MPTKETKEQDMVLLRKWKYNKSPQNASLLVNHLLPLVRSDIYKYSTNLPYLVMEAYAKDLILRACDAYSPSSGVALSTFVKSYMIKLANINQNAHGTLAIPESRLSKYNTFKTSYEELSTKLNREPTVTEIADHIKWSRAEVSRFLSELRHEFAEDRPFVMDYHPKMSKEEEMIDFIYHDLSAREKIIFEGTTGYAGKPKINSQQLMNKLNINQNQLSYEKRKLVEKIEKVLSK